MVESHAIRLPIALFLALALGAAAGGAEDGPAEREPAEDAGAVEDAPVYAGDRTDDRPDPASSSDIAFLGHWAKHGVYVAAVMRITHGGGEAGDDTSWEWAVLPAAFDELNRPTEATAHGAARLDVLPDASAALREELAPLRAVIEKTPLEGAVDARALGDLGIRELPRFQLASCGIEERREARGLRVAWRPIGAGASIGVYERGVESQSGCYALADDTLAVVVNEVATADGRRSTAERLVRARPPPGTDPYGSAVAALVASGAPFVPIGFSPRGRFGWIELGPAGAAMSIVDLPTDREVLRREWPAAAARERGSSATQRAAREAATRGRAAGLWLPLTEETSFQVVGHQGVRFEAWMQEERDGGCGVYLERQVEFGLKRVALLAPEVARGAPELRGVIPSPHEPRVALVISYGRGDGTAAGRRFAAYGAHLAKGFPARSWPSAAAPNPPTMSRGQPSVFDRSEVVELPPRFPLPLPPGARVVYARSEGPGCRARSYTVKFLVDTHYENVDDFFRRAFRDLGLATQHTRGANYVATTGSGPGVEAEAASSPGAMGGTQVSVRWIAR